jgi:hypothetical protein
MSRLLNCLFYLFKKMYDRLIVHTINVDNAAPGRTLQNRTSPSTVLTEYTGQFDASHVQSEKSVA